MEISIFVKVQIIRCKFVYLIITTYTGDFPF